MTKDKTAFIINNEIYSVNLFKYHLDIPYTKKDGTKVTLEQIEILKTLASEKYKQAVKDNKSNHTQAS